MKYAPLAAFAFALCAAAPALAQTMDAERIIERLRAADANRDGAVSRQEFINYRAAQFERLDRNNDGFAAASDMPRFAQRRAVGGMNPGELTAQFDADHDGRVSQAEFVNGPTVVFDRVDANHDNVATESEFDAALTATRAQRAPSS